MNYDTALRGYTAKRIEEIETADILVGIPCYNNENTIIHVIRMVTHGLAKHYNDKRSVIMVADGGSTDDTCEAARDFEIKPWQEKIVSIYRGPGGKGTALRSEFEAATFHMWSVNRNKLLDLMTPLYFARVASFVKESWEMTSEEADALVEGQTMKFEDQKEYFLNLWEGKAE